MGKGTVVVLSVAICFTISAIAASFVAYTIIKTPERIGGGIAAGVQELATNIFNEKMTVNISSQELSVAPISEMAFAKLMVREDMLYSDTWLGSTVKAVLAQKFIVKFGYTSEQVFKISRKDGKLSIPNPTILSIEPVTGAPEIMLVNNGAWNGFSADKALAATNSLKNQIQNDATIFSTQAMIRLIVTQQLKALMTEVNRSQTELITDASPVADR